MVDGPYVDINNRLFRIFSVYSRQIHAHTYILGDIITGNHATPRWCDPGSATCHRWVDSQRFVDDRTKVYKVLCVQQINIGFIFVCGANFVSQLGEGLGVQR